MNYSFDGTTEDLEKMISQAVRAALNNKPSNVTLRKSESVVASVPVSDNNSTRSAKVLSPAPLASILIAVCCSDCLTDNTKSELSKVADQQIKIQIEEAEEWDESIDLHDLAAPHQVLFFPALSENMIAKAASGIFDEPLSRLLLRAIEGEQSTIAIAPELSSGIRMNSPTLFRLRQTHRQKLAQFGVHFTTQKDIAKVLLSTLPKSTFKNVAPQIHAGNKRLLTAQDIEKAAKEGKAKLQVPYRSIITPLAKDRAKDLNIVIELNG